MAISTLHQIILRLSDRERRGEHNTPGYSDGKIRRHRDFKLSQN